MKLPISPPYAPMEAETVDRLPEGEAWLYEPKWDGFRCLVFRDGDEVELQSKSQRSLTRYFPEMVEAVRRLPAERFVLDGELAVPVDGRLDFDELLQRIHPADSRVRLLARTRPAALIVFDLLMDADGEPLADAPLSLRRARLEALAARLFPRGGSILLSPADARIGTARRWLGGSGGDLDGVVAKRLDRPYQGGERGGMVKVKNLRTADCVVGGFRYASSGKTVGSLLLGLHDTDGLLHHVGYTSGLSTALRRELTPRLEGMIEPPGFTGDKPGGPSRWSTERSTQWEPLRPELVVEVRFDHVSGRRFRHGTRLLRFRPDKAPGQCTMDQLRPRPGRPPLDLADPSPGTGRSSPSA